MSTLVLQGVEKRFGGLAAVAGLDLEVPAGRITGLIGPNGAGKTTAVNLVTGLLRASAGAILLDGRDITALDAAGVARAGVARTFQTVRLPPRQTVLEAALSGMLAREPGFLPALLGLPAARRARAAMEADARALVARLGLLPYLHHPAGALSYGHQRRAEMVRALAMRPRVLLLDEPVAGMNDVEADALGEVFQEVAQGSALGDGVAVLLIEHNMRFVMRLCAQVCVLASGRPIARGTPAEVAAHPAVVEAYLGA